MSEFVYPKNPYIFSIPPKNPTPTVNCSPKRSLCFLCDPKKFLHLSYTQKNPFWPKFQTQPPPPPPVSKICEWGLDACLRTKFHGFSYSVLSHQTSKNFDLSHNVQYCLLKPAHIFSSWMLHCTSLIAAWGHPPVSTALILSSGNALFLTRNSQSSLKKYHYRF